MFKTSGGKYSTTINENTMKQSRFIEQIMVIGEGQKMPAALIQPNFEFLKEWAVIHKRYWKSNDEHVLQKKYWNIQQDIDSLNEKFGSWKKSNDSIDADVWSIDGGQLTQH
jgi:long-chain acyl-CoA synthetase